MTDLSIAPPPVRLTGTTRWILLRAFGPEDAPAPLPAEAAQAAFRAERLALAPRIGTRARTRLERELGAAGAAPFSAARRAAAARDAQIEALRARVAETAARVGSPVALLKYAALRAASAVAPGSRLAADLDLLARPAEAERLHEALLEEGFVATGQAGWAHHLEGLAHPRLGAVEIHVHLPGLALPRGERRGPAAWLTLDDLEAAGLLPTGSRGAAGSVAVPDRPILLAHALVHALVQHRGEPAAYPGWRAVSDWIDLGLGREGDDPLPAALPWTGATLAPELAEATRELCAALVRGRPEILEGESPGALLGRHLLAGALDPLYRRSLKIRGLGPAPGAGDAAGARRATLRTVARTLHPSRAELASLYGPWRTRWGLLGRRLIRPLDLAVRTVTAAASRLLLARGTRRTL